jgi:hypothetical protein
MSQILIGLYPESGLSGARGPDFRFKGDCERGVDFETPGAAILLDESVVPGGRVELPTPAFSGPRSTGELPRQFGRQEIVRGLES